MSEEITKGLTLKRLIQIGYPSFQNTEENGVIWFKEDSYKGVNKYLETVFSSASKTLSGNHGSPDFTALDEKNHILIVIECKDSIEKHQTFSNLNHYKNSIGNKSEISAYSINGALHYASYANSKYDVIAIGISGSREENIRVSSFILPQNQTLTDILVIEDDDISRALMTTQDYKIAIDKLLNRNAEERIKVLFSLSQYASSCNNYLRSVGVSSKDRAGFISAIVLALTNESSMLYRNTKLAIESYQPNARPKKPFSDLIGNQAIELLMSSLREIWQIKDKLPQNKIETLEEYYSRIIGHSLLLPSTSNNPYFQDGENVLSCCIYSIFRNIILPLKKHNDIDIMGTFYTAFLKYAKGDAKEKGIVLTPKHITDFFCDLAEHYLGYNLDEKVKILDICCGTGGFLISALHRMDKNITNRTISESTKRKYMREIREYNLIGVESEPEMFALAYANMRFHGDGKSNLFACSSLIKDKETKGIVRNDIDIIDGESVIVPIYLKDELKKMSIDVGMINPPYSLTNEKSPIDKGKKQTGQTELDFVYSMLDYLREGGIGIAIVPISCASTKGIPMREKIAKEHSLLACVTMPPQLFFDSNVGTSTCIMVYRAHVPQSQSTQPVFMARWVNDGFVVVPHNGRYDKNHAWNGVKAEWLSQLNRLAPINEHVYLRKSLTPKEDCLAEAHISTDYTKIKKDDFVRELKRYALFLYMEQKGLSNESDSEKLLLFLDSMDDFERQYVSSILNTEIELKNPPNWVSFNLFQTFSIKSTESQIDRKNMNTAFGPYPYVTRSNNNNGITDYVTEQADRNINAGNCITIGLDTRTFFYQERAFYTGQNIQVMRCSHLNKYIAFFLIAVCQQELFKYSWARGLTLTRLKEFTISLPAVPLANSSNSYEPDWNYMEQYIKTLPYSSALEKAFD